MIIVTGTIDIDPAKRDAAIEACNAVMEPTRKEVGCHQYAFSADLSDPGRFYVTEQWDDEETMGAHMQSPHLAEFMGKLGEFGVTSAVLKKWINAEERSVF